MDRNDKCALTALAILAVAAAVGAAGVLGGFDRPPNAGGLAYEYQTLIGVAGALLAALLTINMMQREQRQQRGHFEKQMDVLIRPDRLRVSRETSRLVPRLNAAMDALHRIATEGVVTQGYTMMDLQNAVAASEFSELDALLDERFTSARRQLEGEVQHVLNDGDMAAINSPDFGFSRDESEEMPNGPTLQKWKDDVEHMIALLEELRADYGLPSLGPS